MKWFIFRNFNIRNFKIPKYPTFNISSFLILTPTQHREFYNLENRYFTNWKIIKYLGVQINSKKWKKKFGNKTIE